MSLLDVIYLSVIFFVTSVISVVTGATSLITVPALLAFGVPAATAIGTNMLALTALSIGATLPFLRNGMIAPDRMAVLLPLTALGSIAGALLVFAVPPNVLPLVIGVAMLTVALVVLRPPRRDPDSPDASSTPAASLIGYGLTLLLGVYGGFFSGGYVTLLTAVFVACFRMSMRRAIGATKLVNVVSSAIATVIFGWRGAIDWQLGALLCVVTYFGASMGARIALRFNQVWLRRIFVIAVLGLAIKTFVSDVPWAYLL